MPIALRVQALIDAAIADKKNGFDVALTDRITKTIGAKGKVFKQALLKEFGEAALDPKLAEETALHLAQSASVDLVDAVGEAIYEKLGNGNALGAREIAIFNVVPDMPVLLASSCVTNRIAITDLTLQKAIIDKILAESPRKLTAEEEALFTGDAALVTAAADAAGTAALADKSTPDLVNNIEVGGELFRRMIVKGKAPLGDEEIALLERGDEFFIRWAAHAFSNDETAISLGTHKKVAEAIRLMTESCLKEGDVALTQDTKDILDQYPFVAKQVADAVAPTPDKKHIIEYKTVAGVLLDQMVKVTNLALPKPLADLLDASDILLDAAIDLASKNPPATAILAHAKLRKTLLDNMVSKTDPAVLHVLEKKILDDALENSDFIAAAAAAALAKPPADVLVAHPKVQAKLIADMLAVTDAALNAAQEVLVSRKENAELVSSLAATVIVNPGAPGAAAVKANVKVAAEILVLETAVARMVAAAAGPLDAKDTNELTTNKALVILAASAALAAPAATALANDPNVIAKLVGDMLAADNKLSNEQADILTVLANAELLKAASLKAFENPQAAALLANPAVRAYIASHFLGQAKLPALFTGAEKTFLAHDNAKGVAEILATAALDPTNAAALAQLAAEAPIQNAQMPNLVAHVAAGGNPAFGAEQQAFYDAIIADGAAKARLVTSALAVANPGRRIELINDARMGDLINENLVGHVAAGGANTFSAGQKAFYDAIVGDAAAKGRLATSALALHANAAQRIELINDARTGNLISADLVAHVAAGGNVAFSVEQQAFYDAILLRDATKGRLAASALALHANGAAVTALIADARTHDLINAHLVDHIAAAGNVAFPGPEQAFYNAIVLSPAAAGRLVTSALAVHANDPAVTALIGDARTRDLINNYLVAEIAAGVVFAGGSAEEVFHTAIVADNAAKARLVTSALAVHATAASVTALINDARTRDLINDYLVAQVVAGAVFAPGSAEAVFFAAIVADNAAKARLVARALAVHATAGSVTALINDVRSRDLINDYLVAEIAAGNAFAGGSPEAVFSAAIVADAAAKGRLVARALAVHANAGSVTALINDVRSRDLINNYLVAEIAAGNAFAGGSPEAVFSAAIVANNAAKGRLVTSALAVHANAGSVTALINDARTRDLINNYLVAEIAAGVVFAGGSPEEVFHTAIVADNAAKGRLVEGILADVAANASQAAFVRDARTWDLINDHVVAEVAAGTVFGGGSPEEALYNEIVGTPAAKARLVTRALAVHGNALQVAALAADVRIATPVLESFVAHAVAGHGFSAAQKVFVAAMPDAVAAEAVNARHNKATRLALANADKTVQDRLVATFLHDAARAGFVALTAEQLKIITKVPAVAVEISKAVRMPAHLGVAAYFNAMPEVGLGGRLAAATEAVSMFPGNPSASLSAGGNVTAHMGFGDVVIPADAGATKEGVKATVVEERRKRY